MPSHLVDEIQELEPNKTHCMVISSNSDSQNKTHAWVCQGVILTALVSQNTIAILLNSHALTPHIKESGTAFNPQTGAILQDFIKILPCFAISVALGERPSAVLKSRTEVLRSGVPGFCYLLQNNLSFVAVSHIGPAEFAATQKIRILFVAVFSSWFLGKKVGCHRWFALMALCFGVLLVRASMNLNSDDTGPSSNQQDLALGVSAAVSASFISAVASVFCEKILKDSSTSLWVRNVHFSVYGCMIGIIGLFVTGNVEQVLTNGLFAGCNTLIVLAIVCNSIGGILVSLALKYINAIAANLSQIVGLLFITLFSVLAQNHRADWMFLLGVAIVCCSMAFYLVDVPLSRVPFYAAWLKFANRLSKHRLLLVGVLCACYIACHTMQLWLRLTMNHFPMLTLAAQ